MLPKIMESSIARIARPSTFTRLLKPDEKIPSVERSLTAPRELLRRSRIVREGFYTWLAPELATKGCQRKLAAVSSRACEDIGLRVEEAHSDEFLRVFSGETLIENTFPWAQAYAGWQFGNWAGQLGDGRVANLFDVSKKDAGTSRSPFYEVQIKGAGLTPYSRFADGKAVLRSSIREFLVSEFLNVLGIPSTRALALIALPYTFAQRERRESCAMVVRMAESWVRLGTFDLCRARGSRSEIRQLCDYLVDVYGLGKDIEDPVTSRYQKMYLDIVSRNAKTIALCQVYGFVNGVLNTDNTSVLGLCMDFGPFALMETFDPHYTPNHDDSEGRYSYENSPSAIWWNMARLGEDLAELLGAPPSIVDELDFIEHGLSTDQVDSCVREAERQIDCAEKVFRNSFRKEYDMAFARRLGLTQVMPSDHESIFDSCLQVLEQCQLDFNFFFWQLSHLELFQSENSLQEYDFEPFFQTDRPKLTLLSTEQAMSSLKHWLTNVYRPRLESGGDADDASRTARMTKVNPHFVPRNWVLNEVIQGCEKNLEVGIPMLHEVLYMTLNPFESQYHQNFQKFTREAPETIRDSQCSCSS